MAFDWSRFYAEQQGRSVRPTFARALELWEGEPGDAIDLGSGDGVEARALATCGWDVLAVDADSGVEERVVAGLTGEVAARLRVRRSSFEELGELPEADLVYAGFALPFCDPGHFPYLWADIREALRPGGLFAGELFGPHDEWFGRPGMSFHERRQVEGMLTGMDVIQLVE